MRESKRSKIALERAKVNFELNETAKFYVKYLWGEDLNIPVSVNYRLRSSLGLCMVDELIYLSKEVMEDENSMMDTLLHELCHWYCFQTGLHYGDNDEDFLNEIDKVGSTLSGTTTFRDGKYVSNAEYGHYKCNKCKREMRVLDTFEELDPLNKWRRVFKEQICCNERMEVIGTEDIKVPFVPSDKMMLLKKAFKNQIMATN